MAGETEVYKKVLAYFFSFPEKSIGLNELSNNIKSSKTAVKGSVVELIKENFLRKQEVGNAWQISMNQQNSYLTTKKIPYNLQMIYEAGIIQKINKKIPNARAIILFGSYRWATDNQNSDIDIAVEILKNEKLKIETLEIIKQIGFRRNVKVNLHIFSRKNININLFTNIANGIILDGLLEVKP